MGSVKFICAPGVYVKAQASVAQPVERVLGKDEVASSNLA